ncbi:hypothetical protein ACFLR0_00095 [Candidatus Bipolaricaulota bacterium]
MGAIHTEEDGDIKAFRRAVQPVSEFYNGCRVRLGVSWQGDEIRVNRDFLEEESEKPFVAFVLADRFFEYITRYKEIVHLGVCRLCGKVYLKPKHGQKSRYCSSSCKQKAYRQRKKESEE